MGPQGVQGTPGVSGYEQIVVASPNNNVTAKTITASCPAGKAVLGGGFVASGVTTTAVLANGPSSATDWTVTVRENQAGAPTWTLTVTAACVTALP